MIWNGTIDDEAKEVRLFWNILSLSLHISRCQCYKKKRMKQLEWKLKACHLHYSLQEKPVRSGQGRDTNGQRTATAGRRPVHWRPRAYSSLQVARHWWEFPVWSFWQGIVGWRWWTQCWTCHWRRDPEKKGEVWEGNIPSRRNGKIPYTVLTPFGYEFVLLWYKSHPHTSHHPTHRTVHAHTYSQPHPDTHTHTHTHTHTQGYPLAKMTGHFTLTFTHLPYPY